jgi:hypothetical protein
MNNKSINKTQRTLHTSAETLLAYRHYYLHYAVKWKSKRIPNLPVATQVTDQQNQDMYTSLPGIKIVLFPLCHCIMILKKRDMESSLLNQVYVQRKLRYCFYT